MMDEPFGSFPKVRKSLTCIPALTKQSNLFYTSTLLRKWQSGVVFGLKPDYGGSIPSFLAKKIEPERMQALQTCGREGGSRAATRCL